MAGVRIGGAASIASGSFPYTIIDSGFVVDVWRVINGVPTNLTNHSADAAGESEKWNPILSPDGSIVVYSVQNADTFALELWSVPATGGTPTMLKDDPTNPLMYPFFHPDGSHFLYTQSLNGDWGGEIRRMDADGSNDALILAVPGTDQMYFRPQYNRDGSLIVFARDDAAGGSTDYTLRVCEPDGSNEVEVRTLAQYAEDGSQFAFANTSDRIAFWDGLEEEGSGECYTVDPDGTDLVQISDGTDVPYRISKYCWLPDDSLVLGTTFDDAAGRFFLTSFDPSGGPTQTVLEATHGAGAFLNRRQGWYWRGRFYLLEYTAVTSAFAPELLVSFLADGSDYRVEQDAADPPVSNAFLNGNGPEFL